MVLQKQKKNIKLLDMNQNRKFADAFQRQKSLKDNKKIKSNKINTKNNNNNNS